MSRKKSVTIPKRRLVFTLAILVGLTLSSCSAVRTITNTAESFEDEKGMKVIQTKIVESYVGTKEKR